MRPSAIAREDRVVPARRDSVAAGGLCRSDARKGPCSRAPSRIANQDGKRSPRAAFEQAHRDERNARLGGKAGSQRHRLQPKDGVSRERRKLRVESSSRMEFGPGLGSRFEGTDARLYFVSHTHRQRTGDCAVDVAGTCSPLRSSLGSKSSRGLGISREDATSPHLLDRANIARTARADYPPPSADCKRNPDSLVSIHGIA